MADWKSINGKIIDGYALLYEGQTVKACDIWLEAWSELKELMDENSVSTVYDMNLRYKWVELPINYVQELEQELHNAGIDDPTYHDKRISYCRELLGYVGANELMMGNTRRAIADAYFEKGDIAECDRLYGEWLEADPLWGWGYLGWHICYAYKYQKPEKQDIAKASMIIGRALSEPGVRDRIDVLDRAVQFYEEHGGMEAEKISAMREELSRLEDEERASIPVTPPKVGRNDPCPCGSGKKYKKCHGRVVE